MEENNQTEQKEVNNKLWVGVFFAGLVITAGLVAFFMVQNYQKKDSQERYRLTKIYKKVKDENYKFNFPNGHIIYSQHCAKCHGKSGQGVSPYPKLANSAFVQGDPKKVLKLLVHGVQGPTGEMPSYKLLTYLELTDVLNYIRRSFGNKAEVVDPIEAVKTKIDTMDRKTPYKSQEL